MSIFSCFRKKENLQSWLDKKFPGQFEVVDSRRRFMEKFQFSKKVTSVVAFKQDTLVEFVIVWYRDAPDLRMTTTEVEDALAKSKLNVANAHHLFGELTAKDPFHVSVGVIDSAAYFLVYAEPTLANRKKYLDQILQMLDHAEHTQKDIWIEFMEDTAYYKEFKDIVSAGYWNRIDHFHQDNKTVSMDFKWSPGIKSDSLMPHWAANTESLRSSLWREEAYKSALIWAEKNIKSPYYIEPVQLVWNDPDEHDPMSIHFHFPYYPAKPAEDNEDPEANRIGFISGVYQVDKKTFSKIEKGAEF